MALRRGLMSIRLRPRRRKTVRKIEVAAGRTPEELAFSIKPRPREAWSTGDFEGEGSVYVGYLGGGSGSKDERPPFPFAKVRPPVEGTVLDPFGRPVADAVVGLRPWFESKVATHDEGGDPNFLYGNSTFDVDPKLLAKRFVHTDASGRFALRERRPDRVGIDRSDPRATSFARAGRIARSWPERRRPADRSAPVVYRQRLGGRVVGGKPCTGITVTIRQSPIKVVFGQNDSDVEPDYGRNGNRTVSTGRQLRGFHRNQRARPVPLRDGARRQAIYGPRIPAIWCPKRTDSRFG